MKETLTIPQVRARLTEVAQFLRADIPEYANDIDYLVTQLYRRKPIRRAPVQSHRMDRPMSQDIRAYAAKHPTMTEQAIGVVFGVIAGRVSEALHGKRGG